MSTCVFPPLPKEDLFRERLSNIENEFILFMKKTDDLIKMNEENIKKLEESSEKLLRYYEGVVLVNIREHSSFKERLDDLYNRLKKLEYNTKGIRDLPYICPLCKGMREVGKTNIEPPYVEYSECKVCNGKGVIWG